MACTHICAHVKDPTYIICRERVGFTAGGMETQKTLHRKRTHGKCRAMATRFLRRKGARISHALHGIRALSNRIESDQNSIVI